MIARMTQSSATLLLILSTRLLLRSLGHLTVYLNIAFFSSPPLRM